jgi:membrane protein DedA with SNARE-associated domain
MTLENLIITYGYLAVFIGTFLEGETVLLLGGLAAHLGYLHLAGVAGAAFAGSIMGDQLAFYLGRRSGSRLMKKWPRLHERVLKVHLITARYRSWIVVAFRFFYGLRNIVPFTLGMSSISFQRFLALNALGAVLWTITIGGGGFLFGKAMEAVLGDMKRYEVTIMAVIAAAGLTSWLVHLVRSSRRPAGSS